MTPHRQGIRAALPALACWVVFFAIVAVIHDQHLFEPLIRRCLQLESARRLRAVPGDRRAIAISDNVFVATIIAEIKAAF